MKEVLHVRTQQVQQDVIIEITTKTGQDANRRVIFFQKESNSIKQDAHYTVSLTMW